MQKLQAKLIDVHRHTEIKIKGRHKSWLLAYFTG